MYVVKGKTWVVCQPDGSAIRETATDKVFHSGVEMLLWAIRSGEIRLHLLRGGGYRTTRVIEVHLIHLPGDSDWQVLHSTFYSLHKYEWTIEHWRAMYAAQQRVKELWHYISEVEPEWRDKEEVHYMDSSVAVIQVDKYGHGRRVMLEYPSGDACY
ncbi:hypothetical protein [Streptomyces sp. UNOC14_S4]|uniref:hypothetical protein n=1 Tax=Streptomyces sp. UNOC14_S4 TaxID=2872340 RepID=UPI001E5406BE|nr:hypothetical protein [Streptomyces sp. UNOC14_S4]MCC3766478.1 hypothetical protein [Streptomyces sp. UNOC14_S4]